MEEYIFYCQSCTNGKRGYWVSFADPVPEDEDPGLCPFCGSTVQIVAEFHQKRKPVMPETLEIIGAIMMTQGRRSKMREGGEDGKPTCRN